MFCIFIKYIKPNLEGYLISIEIIEISLSVAKGASIGFVHCLSQISQAIERQSKEHLGNANLRRLARSTSLSNRFRFSDFHWREIGALVANTKM